MSRPPFFRGIGPVDERGILSTATRTRSGMASFTRGEHKLIVDRETDERWMFNVVKDPREFNNLAWRNRDLALQLLDDLRERLHNPRERELFEPGDAPISEERRELLKSLGYTN